MSKTKNRPVDEISGTETTGHLWDGITELDTPLPRWWLILLYASIVWALIYWVFMPALPLLTSYTPGLRNHSDRANVARDLAALEARRAPFADKLQNASLTEIESDPSLQEFALAAGASVFGDNCATCHGSGAAGAKGFPNLNDDVWLWGGSLDEIAHTLKVGIRSTHPETRYSAMPAYGRDGLLTPEQIQDVTEHVLKLSGQDHDAGAAGRGQATFLEQCSACHGETGLGDRLQGAPRLNDADWLYGGSREEIRAQITNAQAGVMPAWEARLTPAMLKAVAVYVHARGGGE
ncbi:MAG TPA: cytochrome-c oxidase, cbb3-type subunit III [Hyphomonadaceae bacterium]|nr:cytochrome-c oxidase, cbb3-type subunit III [Hyphomonadaceae bacterium]